MSLTVILTIVSIVALILAIIASIFAIISFVQVEALKRSTHTVQLTPVDPEIDRHNENLLKQWATQQETLDKQRKMAKEELADKMEEFVEEEVEIISF